MRPGPAADRAPPAARSACCRARPTTQMDTRTDSRAPAPPRSDGNAFQLGRAAAGHGRATLKPRARHDHDPRLRVAVVAAAAGGTAGHAARAAGVVGGLAGG